MVDTDSSQHSTVKDMLVKIIRCKRQRASAIELPEQARGNLECGWRMQRPKSMKNKCSQFFEVGTWDFPTYDFRCFDGDAPSWN
jgi:hypothetical protein